MKTMFGVEQNRTEILLARGEAKRSAVNVRQEQCAPLPWAGRALAATPMGPGSSSAGTSLGSGGQQAEQGPEGTETREVQSGTFS